MHNGVDDSSSSRKRSRRAASEEPAPSSSCEGTDPRLFDLQFPKEHEARLFAAIFELGLKHSSPKLLMPLMPADAQLSTEHLKSHLQKYRIHKQRSKDEFSAFYDSFLKREFDRFDMERAWEQQPRGAGAGGAGAAPSPIEELDGHMEELGRLQELLTTTNGRIGEWKALVQEVEQNSAALTAGLSALTAEL